MKTLPDLPNLQFLLREAKAIKASHRNGDASICEIVGHYDTSLFGLTDKQIFDTHFSILDAQRVVARQYGFSSWSKLKRFTERCRSGRNPMDPSLRTMLLARHKEMITLMEDVREKRGDYKAKYAQYRMLSQDSTSFLNSAYDQHGWPGPDVIGLGCVDKIMVVAGNAGDAVFQRRTVEHMGKGVSEGSFLSVSHGLLLDRYLVLSGEPSIYGTGSGYYYDSEGNVEFLIEDVVDPENLDKRRATVGFISMEAESKRCREEAKKDNWKLITREQFLKERNQLALQGGYQQH